MADEQKEEELRERNIRLIFDFDRANRAHIIYEATALYKEIGEITAWHFYPDETKHLSFIALMFQRAEVSFSKKIEIFERILSDWVDELQNHLRAN
jgi:hypothetical protein